MNPTPQVSPAGLFLRYTLPGTGRDAVESGQAGDTGVVVGQ